LKVVYQGPHGRRAGIAENGPLFAWHLDQIALVIGGDAFLLQFWDPPCKLLSSSHISPSFLFPTVSTHHRVDVR